MPADDLLPEELRPLVRRQAVFLRHDRLRSDLRDLVPFLQKALATSRPQRGPRAQPGPHSPREPWTPGEAFRDIDAPWCPEMVVVPAGTFMMGSPDSETGRYDDEGPQHRVTISRPFAIGRFPVTFEEYDNFCEATGREQPGDEGWGRGRCPVINVSWDDAQAYVKWLAAATGRPYRLPSEAEWEYACRAGTTTRFSFGNDISGKDANIDGSRTTEVGTYPANAWGLHDMHGNVWEWVEDCWHDSYAGAPEDGSAWLDADGDDFGPRVLRGGSWYYSQDLARAAYRNRYDPFYRSYDFGFRVVCSSPSSGH
ncbi:MAG: formylglycine-generating enzyme family protein [Rhodospirillales bacterium]|nr:formylglycine-generating enzyme family protein [Rhodospirillales bacterium]